MALIPVDEALARILKGAKPLGVETIELAEAHGRVLAKAIVAKRDQPPFAASAMDGYAFRFDDLGGRSGTLTLTGMSAAGHAYGRIVQRGAAVRIFTGAPLPKGADTVVIQENCSATDGSVAVSDVPPKGKNIRNRGLDFEKGDTLVPAKLRLGARDLGLAAAANAPAVSVYRKPRIALLTTGDELVAPGDSPRADQIFSSNSTALEAMFKAFGADVINLGIVKDDLRKLTSVIARSLKGDVLVTTGGASVGEHDYVQEALKRAGVRIDFWKIALRPGKPLMFGSIGKCRVIGLPGNPVSAIVCSRIFIKPLIDQLLGLPLETRQDFALLATNMPDNDNRQDYVRAHLEVAPNGLRTVTPLAKQDSSMQYALRQAQCLIIRPPYAPAVRAGDQVPIMILDF
jgi:molybdopterin molybdotransferase